MTNRQTMPNRTKWTTGDLPDMRDFAVGFDEVFDSLFNPNFNRVNNYPPYNIVKQAEDHYVIEMAVAGFVEDELSVELNGRTLVVSGTKQDSRPNDIFMHKGLAERNFENRFTLAPNVVVGDVKLAHGMLRIFLDRHIPDEEKPKKFSINSD